MVHLSSTTLVSKETVCTETCALLWVVPRLVIVSIRQCYHSDNSNSTTQRPAALQKLLFLNSELNSVLEETVKGHKYKLG